MQIKNHLPSFLTALLLVLSALVLIVLALIMGISSLMDLFGRASDPASGMIMAFAFGGEMTLVLVCAWFVAQKTLNRESADLPTPLPFSGIHLVFIAAVFIVVVLLGAGIGSLENKWLSFFFIPVLNLLAISTPILFILTLGGNGLEFGPRWRTWGALGISLTAGPVLMFILEMLALAFLVILAIIFIASNPNMTTELLQLAERIQSTKNEELILKMLAPYIANPVTIAGIVGLLSLIVPIIEELFKPLAVWLFARSIEKPSHGFMLGMLGGAAFALTESLNVSGDGTIAWVGIVSVRAATSLLHVTTAGMMGFAIVLAFKEKRIAQLFGTYAAAILIHGLWNAGAVSAGVSSLGELIGKPQWATTYLPVVFCFLMALGISILTIFIITSRKVKALEQSTTNTATTTEETDKIES